MAGKLITGLFGRPLNQKEFLTVGFSMSAWGEFAFIIATASFEDGTIDEESFSAVLLAVLLSVIVSPYGLRLTLSHYEQHAQRRMDEKLKKYESSRLHPVYFAILTKARGQWGHQDKILHEIFQLDLEIIDFRSWHAPEYNFTHHLPLTKESFYVMDTELLLPPTKHLAEGQKQRLNDKVSVIRSSLRQVLGQKSVINIKRWLPGVLKREDTMDKTDKMFGEHVVKKVHSPSYCRRAAFKQAHLIMSSRDLRIEKVEESGNGRNFLKPERVHTLSSRTRKRHSASELGLAQVIEARTAPKPQLSVPGPGPMAKTQSVPTESVEHQLKVTAIHLLRQLSAPENASVNHSYTGTGHGGQGKGAGALPFTNNMINIHDHFEEDDEDSCSYIYGDEDAEHHTLPSYESPRAGPAMKGAADKMIFHGDSTADIAADADGLSHDVEGSTLEIGGKAKGPAIGPIEEEEERGASRSVTLSMNIDSEIMDNIEIVMTDLEDSSDGDGHSPSLVEGDPAE